MSSTTKNTIVAPILFDMLPRGYTLEEVAKIMGDRVSVRTLYRWRNGNAVPGNRNSHGYLQALVLLGILCRSGDPEEVLTWEAFVVRLPAYLESELDRESASVAVQRYLDGYEIPMRLVNLQGIRKVEDSWVQEFLGFLGIIPELKLAAIASSRPSA